MPGLRIGKIGYALGAEVRGVELKSNLDDEAISEIRQVWLEHLLLCFPGQDLNADELLAFGRRFGELDKSGQLNPGQSPYITQVTERPINGRPWSGYKTGQVWHSDKSYTTNPISASMLNAKEIPEVGGDTMFANQYMAYDSLSPAMQGILEGLSSVHDYELRLRSNVNDARTSEGVKLAAVEDLAARGGRRIPTAQPVVRVHSETGRKALYINQRVRQFVGMTEEESGPLLDYLKAHAVRYEFTYRHRWTVNDLVMWDNRCLMHIALGDYRLERDPRYLIKCAVLGPKSGYAYDSDADAASSTAAPKELVAGLS
jgi:taurine dioxygenase